MKRRPRNAQVIFNLDVPVRGKFAAACFEIGLDQFADRRIALKFDRRICRVKIRSVPGLRQDITGPPSHFRKHIGYVFSKAYLAHLLLDKRLEMHGTDIDPINMSHLQQTGYDKQKYVLMKPGGSIPFPDESFDACFGISVFTHLTETLQDKYLAELHRVLKPDGVGIFSVHGLLHFFARINDAQMFSNWMRNGGYWELGDNQDLQGFSTSAEKLYVDALHTRGYVMNHWKKFFPEVDVIEGLNTYSHDLVVCKKMPV